jgi:hypothetical protein
VIRGLAKFAQSERGEAESLAGRDKSILVPVNSFTVQKITIANDMLRATSFFGRPSGVGHSGDKRLLQSIAASQ